MTSEGHCDCGDTTKNHPVLNYDLGKESGKNIGKYISLDGTAPGFGGGSKSQVFRISPGDGLKIHLLCAALTDI